MSRYAKAIVALLGAVATWGITAAEDNAYSQVELWGALLAAVTALGVYAWPNQPPSGRQADPGISEQDAGHGQVDTLTVVLTVAVLVVLLVLVL